AAGESSVAGTVGVVIIVEV
ncbi:hypothetical protein Tco_0734540, partial [Tanacetum coccineum]